MNPKPSRGRLRHPERRNVAAKRSGLRAHHALVMVALATIFAAAAKSQGRGTLTQEIAEVAAAPVEVSPKASARGARTPARSNTQTSATTRHMRINLLMNRIASAPRSPEAAAAMTELKRELAAAGIKSVSLPR